MSKPQKSTAIICQGCGHLIRSFQWRGKPMWMDDDGLKTCPESGLGRLHDPVATCTNCGHEWGEHQWRKVGEVRWRSGRPPTAGEMYETRCPPGNGRSEP